MPQDASSRNCDLTPLFTALVVEDDPAISATVSQALRQSGFEPLTFRQHHDIIGEIKDRRFNLAFIDVKEGDASGLELAATLKQRNQVGDCIIMAAGAAVNTVVRAVKLGAYDFLQKPFTPSDLRLIISQVRERWELKQRVRRAELQHAALIQNIPLLIFALTPDLDLAFINRTVEDMLGVDAQTAMHSPRWLVERLHPQDRLKVEELLESSFETGQPISAECRLMHKRGAVVHGLIRTIPSLECDTFAGEIRRLDGIFVDLTDRVHLEQALVQSAKLKTLGAISSEVAHEVRNPLMSIAGFARRLEKKAPETPEVGIILRESKRLESLLNRIRDYLKPVEIQPREVAVNIILADALHMITPEMESRRVWCNSDMDEGLPPALADPHVLTQVALGLLRSALMATEANHSFTLRTYFTAGSVHIECRHAVDPSRPINPDMALLPFDEGGFNAGLPMSHRLVKSMDGAMHVIIEDGPQRDGADARRDAGQGEVVVTVTLPQADNGALARHVAAGPLGAAPVPADVNGGGLQYCFENGGAIFSQALLEDLLARALRSGQSNNQPTSLVLLDLDRFEDYAKQYGHADAEDVLRRVAEALSHSLARNACAMLARHGVQELAVILPDTDSDASIKVAESLRLAVSNLGIPHAGREAADVVTTSVGVATSQPDQPLALQDILAEAGKALFQAKQNGRNTVCCAVPEMFAPPASPQAGGQ